MTKKQLRVLIVEDNLSDAELVELELVKGGYAPTSLRVQTAADMTAAFAAAEWDLILCDYMMPRFTGLEALELLKATGKDIPFILMSGSAGEEIAVRAMKAGAQDYFMKGKLALLVPAIQRELREAELRSAARTQLEHIHRNEKLAALGTLLAGVAHELNNPLTVIMHQAALLQRGLKNDPRQARADMIFQAVKRCSRIVKNFLALARHEPPRRLPVSINDAMRAVMELISYSLRADRIAVTLDLVEPIPSVSADPQELQQVIINLLSNAQYALRSQPGTRTLRISTGISAGGEVVTLHVTDNAGGIPPGIRSHIFDPFFTTKPAGQGTGLGLALCHGMIAAHNGTIGVESEEDKGTTFIITLPIGAVAGPDVTGDDAGAQPASVPAQRILVVDDEPDVASALSDMLLAQGHRVQIAGSGRTALQLLERDSFDIVVTDMRMPDLDGPALYREAVAIDPLLECAFVFVTGDIFSAETQAFLSQTGAVRLAKPCTFEEIEDAVRQIVRERPQGPIVQ